MKIVYSHFSPNKNGRHQVLPMSYPWPLLWASWWLISACSLQFTGNPYKSTRIWKFIPPRSNRLTDSKSEGKRKVNKKVPMRNTGRICQIFSTSFRGLQYGLLFFFFLLKTAHPEIIDTNTSAWELIGLLTAGRESLVFFKLICEKSPGNSLSRNICIQTIFWYKFREFYSWNYSSSLGWLPIRKRT